MNMSPCFRNNESVTFNTVKETIIHRSAITKKGVMIIDTKVNNASFLESVLCFDGNLKWSLGKLWISGGT